MIPEGWRSSKIGKISEGITSGSRGWAAYYADSGSPFIRITNLRRTSIFPDYGPMKYVALPDSSNEGRRTELRQGDILVSITADLGVIGYIESRPETPSYISQHIARVRIKSGAADPRFIAYQLAAPRHAQIIERLNDAGAKAGLNLPTIASIPVLLPSLAEQRLIAETLHTWDRAIETVEALIANARAQKQALMQQLLPQGTTPPKRRLLGFSGEWRKIHIGDVAKEVSERAGEKTGYPVLSCSKYDGMVESLSYFKKKVYSDDTSNYKVMRRGTFGFPSNHVEEGSIGYQDLCNAGIVSPIYCVFATSKEVDDGFLYKLLKTDRYRQIFAAATNASVDRRGSLRWKEFSRIPLPLPPLEEQRAISEAVDAVAATETAYQAQLTALRQEKAALMQQLLTGKRRVKLPESEVV